MEETVSKEECDEKHSRILEIVERLECIICGTYDDNSQRIPGLVDVVSCNTKEIGKLSAIKSYILNFLCVILGGVLTGTSVFFITHLYGG